jgi:hypothetical protein
LDLLAAISESDIEAELTRTTLNAGQQAANGKPPAGFSESLVDVKCRVVVRPARSNPQAPKFSDRILPAQIAVLAAELPETLVLMEAKR